MTINSNVKLISVHLDVPLPNIVKDGWSCRGWEYCTHYMDGDLCDVCGHKGGLELDQLKEKGWT